MTAFKTSVSALALVALVAGGIGAATLVPSDVMAQATTTAPAAPDQAHKGWHHHRFDPAARARFLEGRIAFIKTVLQITPAQESAFNGLADAMRANAKERAGAFEQWRGNKDKPMTAVDRVEVQVKALKMRETGRERILAAIKPLYASLTPGQKKVADHLVGGMGHHGWHGHRG